MRILIDNPHREYLNEHGEIVFEELFPVEKTQLMRQEIDLLIGERSKKKKLTDLEAFQFGRDLSRESPALKKLLTHRTLGHMVADLVEQKPIRFGFDQWFQEGSPRPRALKDFGSIQGILLFVLIDLSADSNGSVYFLSPSSPFPEGIKEGLLIGYTGPDCVYVYREKDPLAHELKKLGYSLGDRLTDTTHPTVYR